MGGERRGVLLQKEKEKGEMEWKECLLALLGALPI